MASPVKDISNHKMLFTTTDDGGIVTSNNNMNSKVNKKFDKLPQNLGLYGKTPSGKPRLFVCKICTRAFARQEHLTRHERSHTKEKPYFCGICDRRFSRRDLLLRHAHKLHGGNCGETIKKGRKRKCVSVMSSIDHGDTSRSMTREPSDTNGRSELPSNSSTENYTEESADLHQPLPQVAATKGYSANRISKKRQPRSLQRRASFSAQSAENYAVIPQPTTEHQVDRVEFSTPPLLPVDFATQDAIGATPNDFNLLDKDNWINEVNALALLDESDSSDSDRRRSSWKINGDNVEVKSLFNNDYTPPDWRSSGTSSRNSTQVASLFRKQQGKRQHSVTETLSTRLNDFQLNTTRSHSAREASSNIPTRSGTGIESHEFEFPAPLGQDQQQQQEQQRQQKQQQLQLEQQQKFATEDALGNFANDVTSAFDGLVDDGYTFYGLDYPDMANITRASPKNSLASAEIKVQFFTEEVRCMCKKALEYYTLHCTGGQPTKKFVVPSCKELNLYATYFLENFLPHYPFIHKNLLFLDIDSFRSYLHDGSFQFTTDEMMSFSNVVCLPLFIVTIGSLYKKGAKTKTLELYEMSRCVLHVYLDTRKSLKEKRIDVGCSGNLWLVQSLCLSVMFRLFADSLESVNSEMLIKQVSAVSSLVKSNLLSTVSQAVVDFPSQAQYIFYESKLRTSIMIYSVCQFLKIFYGTNSSNFLSEHDLDQLVIPDGEQIWDSTIFNSETGPIKKQYVTNFQTFYQSFTFSNIGMHTIPECLINAMLFYEFRTFSRASSFHVFLTKIDTKKMELNLPPLNENDTTNSHALIKDGIDLKNSLMAMIFFNKIDPQFGRKVWNNAALQLYETYLSPKKLNVLTRGSYSLITDFLVALSFSIKNVAALFRRQDENIEFDRFKLSAFNLQGYYYNFLVLVKFILDFESTPNFKLLCIFTELKKLATGMLLPKLSSVYPLEFAKFEQIGNPLVDTTPGRIMNSPNYGKITSYSSVNVDQLEKLINNVLVYSFNDTNFLKMSEQAPNEFMFSQRQKQPSQRLLNSDFTPIPTQSSLNLLQQQQDQQSRGIVRQGFAERYHLSEKYIAIAKCFFLYIFENNSHCHFLEKLSSDLLNIERKVEEENSMDQFLKTTHATPLT